MSKVRSNIEDAITPPRVAQLRLGEASSGGGERGQSPWWGISGGLRP